MDAPLLLALAHRRLKSSGSLGVEGVWVGPRALGLAWRKEGWVLLLHPKPELWLLPLVHPAWKLLEKEASKDGARAWGAWLKSARLVQVEGDPRDRWVGLWFQRRAITGKLETVRVAYQAIPGRAGVRMDGIDVQVARLGLGAPFPYEPPATDADPPPLQRWKARFGARGDDAWRGLLDEVMEGEGDLEARHRAWSARRAEELILSPRAAAQRKALEQRGKRLQKWAEDLQADRLRHQRNLAWKTQAAQVSAELYRFKGATGTVTLLDGSELRLPEGRTAEDAAQLWFAAGKKAERGLARVAEMERELQRERQAFEAQGDAPMELSSSGTMETKERKKVDPQPSNKGGKRADGKGKAFRSVQVEGFDILIGKGDAENDQLTFKVADNLDVWLHVAGMPGSHVVIRNPDRLSELPREVVERAAQLAAFHSKAREGGKVEVHVARIADINKPKGFAPGKVILKKWTSVRVYPKE